MEWKNIHLRFQELKNGDLVVCRLESDCNWNKTNLALAVYQDGLLYDAWCKEDNIMPKEDWEITEIVCEYYFTGENVENNISTVIN